MLRKDANNCLSVTPNNGYLKILCHSPAESFTFPVSGVDTNVIIQCCTYDCACTRCKKRLDTFIVLLEFRLDILL